MAEGVDTLPRYATPDGGPAGPAKYIDVEVEASRRAAGRCGKLPAFQFYTKDWREDLELQSCSLAAQGLWINALCIAHQAKPYGHLVINGRAMSVQQIANAIGISPRECKKLLDELEAAGVSSMSSEGAIFSRRMVRDQITRDKRAEGGKSGGEHGHKGAAHGSKGGRPKKENGGSENPPSDEREGGSEGGSETPIKPPPSSSSSSPSSNTEDTRSAPATDAGRVCLLLRRAGITDCNPGHPDLLALIDAGATDAEFENAAAQAIAKGKGFAYTLGVLKGQRKDAAQARAGMHQGAMPTQQRQPTAAEQRVLQAIPGLAAPHLRAALPMTIENEVHDVTPRRLG